MLRKLRLRDKNGVLIKKTRMFEINISENENLKNLLLILIKNLKAKILRKILSWQGGFRFPLNISYLLLKLGSSFSKLQP